MNPTATFGPNLFADITYEEFSILYKGHTAINSTAYDLNANRTKPTTE